MYEVSKKIEKIIKKKQENIQNENEAFEKFQVTLFFFFSNFLISTLTKII
jgi:hypothetical protein